MANPYKQILSKPGAWQFSSAALFARLPISMVGIGIVLMVSDSQLYGSYGLAGQVAAVFVVAQAIAAPQIAKLIDTYGQARVMRPAIAISMGTLVLLAIAATRLSPTLVLFVLAAIVGATMGSIGSLVRTRWNAVVANPTELHTAYSLESVLDEVVFVVGPVLATILATTVHPTAGIAVAVVAAVIGGYAFLAQRSTEPAPSGRREGGHGPSLLRSPAMIVLIVVFICMGAIFGATDVSTVAFAEEAGSKGLSGVILACFAGGSLVGGLFYGARTWRSSLWRRFAIGTVALAVGVTLFFFASTLWILAGVMLVVGLAIAPTLITGNALVQAIVPHERLTEGLTWIGTALGVGVAGGSAIAGPMIDAHGSHQGFLVTIGAGAIAVVVTIVTMALRGRRSAAADRNEAVAASVVE
ncbi:MFS transporter [Serinibacter arcticus]|uniref:ABC transporter, permease protein n=1 Tax=Serinibacter arcticus TaxID=1655435 RepID=A0A4Z1E6M3_9MICO|nr:MFS transporter [Serinibacter arcticus]TGO05337.1 ABC transporter, permease protein [Serinibacter arcticus]